MATEYKLSYTAEEIDEKLGKVDEAVLYTSQDLNEDQKAQTRENIGATTIDEVFEATDVQFYSNLSTAIADINNGVTDNALSALDTGKVKVFTDSNGATTVMLLDDVAEATQIDVNKDIRLVLAGHTLSFTGTVDSLVFGEDTDCVIDGTVAGSAIYKNVTGSGTNTIVQAKGKRLVIHGGEYTLAEPSTTAIAFRISTGYFGMYGATVNCSAQANATHCRAVQTTVDAIFEKCTINAMGAQKPIGVAIGGGVVQITDCTINVSNGSTETMGVWNMTTGATLIVENSSISAISTVTTQGLRTATGTQTHLSNSVIFADAPQGHVGTTGVAVGVYTNGTLFCKDTNVTGTHSGISNHGKLYVSGGTFLGSTHGGFYLCHGADGIAYIRDATIRCGEYNGQFTDFWTSGENTRLGAMYVGGGSAERHSNITAFLDGCVLNDTYNGTDKGAWHCLVLRGTDGETGHNISISNSQVTGYIRIDNETMKLNVGVGTNITPSTLAGSAVNYTEFTDKLYRKHHESETLNGNDFATLDKNDVILEDQTKVSYTEKQDLTEEQKAQARDNLGLVGYYHTDREEIEVTHENFTADYIYSLYDALMAEYPDRVQKNEILNDDGTFTNYEYVISTGEYSAEGYNGGNDTNKDGLGDYLDTDLKKPKLLILSGIHGGERKAAFSAYRFIRDVMVGHNVPAGFIESTVIHIMPVGNPFGFTAFTRTNDRGVDINRNFDWNWEASESGGIYYSGVSAMSEKETQAIANWLRANHDAEVFVDCHNSAVVNEVTCIMGLADDEETDHAKRIALRGIDRVIPFWRDVIKYQRHEARPDGTWLDPVYSYSSSQPVEGTVVYYAADVLGIPSIVLELSSLQNGNFSDWYADQSLITPETIAAGAEALGNILIEFYMDTSEVVNMTGVNNRLDILAESLESMSRGFRTESGVMVIDADMLPPEGSSNFWVRVPCSNGAKMVVFHADSETLTSIKATSGIKYLGSIMVNCFAPEVADGASKLASYMSIMNFVNDKYGWQLLGGSSSNAENTDGVRFKTFALKAGTYNWTAYYWND